MIKNQNIPQIRFNGFGEEWEEKELHQLVNLCSGRDYKHLSNGNIPVYGTGGYMLSVNQALSYDKDAIGIGRKGTIDKPYILKAPFWTVDTLFYAVPKEKNNLAFIYSSFQKINWKQKDESTGVPSLSKVTINSIKIFTSNFAEQTRIGDYFQRLDKLIEQKEKKYQKLRQFKKAMLDKMFPKNGAAIPEIRFKGFSGKWEEKNWSETVDISTNMVDPRIKNYDELFHIGPGNIESFSGKIYNNVLKIKDSNLISGKFHFKKNDIIYGKINPQLAKYIIAPFEGLTSADAYVLNAKNGIVQNYLYLILQTDAFYKYSVSVSTRTGMPKINREELGVYNYQAPTVAEQTKIGNYFQKLDILIDLHSRELEKLKNIKKASLDKMFV